MTTVGMRSPRGRMLNGAWNSRAPERSATRPRKNAVAGPFASAATTTSRVFGDVDSGERAFGWRRKTKRSSGISSGTRRTSSSTIAPMPLGRSRT